MNLNLTLQNWCGKGRTPLQLKSSPKEREFGESSKDPDAKTLMISDQVVPNLYGLEEDDILGSSTQDSHDSDPIKEDSEASS